MTVPIAFQWKQWIALKLQSEATLVLETVGIVLSERVEVIPVEVSNIYNVTRMRIKTKGIEKRLSSLIFVYVEHSEHFLLFSRQSSYDFCPSHP